MTVKIARRDYDNDEYIQKIQKLWQRIDRSEMDKQRVISYLRGLQVAATRGRHPDWDKELEMLMEMARCR